MLAPVATSLLSHPVLVVALHRVCGPTLIDRAMRAIGALAALGLLVIYVQVCQQAVERGQRFVTEHRATGVAQAAPVGERS